MSGIFDKIASIFVEKDEKETKPKAKASKPNTPVEKKTKADDKVDISELAISGDGSKNNQFNKLLLEALENSNLEGFDYLEFRKAVASVSKLQAMDESTQYKTAFAAAQAMNVSPKKLLDSAKHYISVLETEKNQFEKSATGFLNNQTAELENRIAQTQNDLAVKTKQIEKLKAEIASAKTNLDNYQSQVKSARAKVDQSTVEFGQSFRQLVHEIESDIQKIKKYLK